jgi:hypothetical protein
MYLVLSAFTSSPISLVATTKASAFSFTISNNKMVAAHIQDVGSRLARYVGKICNFYLMQYTVFVECKITKEWSFS